MKHVFIINPTSGRGHYKKVVEWLENNFELNNDDSYEIRYTEYKGHATEIARSYSDAIIYSVGGDGTAHEIVNGINPESHLAIIPVGTGNDFFRMYETKGTIEDILERTVKQGKSIKIDVCEVNKRKFLNCSNIGVDADINNCANQSKSKSWLRNFVYLRCIIKCVARMQPTYLEIKNDKVDIKQNVTLFSVMNGSWYGNGFKSAPQAVLDDGYFNVIIADELKISQVLKLIKKYKTGNHLNESVIHTEKLEEFRLKTNTPVNYGCDGEIFQSDSLHYKIHKQHLNLRVPNGANPALCEQTV